MKFDYGQADAIDKAGEFLKDSNRKVMKIFGPAGSGKTTIAKRIAELCGGRVVFGAFTGKAASVLRKKGCPGATTVHRLFFKPGFPNTTRLTDLRTKLIHAQRALAQDPKNETCQRNVKNIEGAIKEEERTVGQPKFKLNYVGEGATADLVIIDEVSMIDEAMGRGILEVAKKIIVTGDPYQLPPMFGAGYFTDGAPDVMLDQVHRQGSDSPILELATQLRRGRGWRLGEYGKGCRVITTDDERREELCLGADQMIVGRNDTRFNASKSIRQLMGLDKGDDPGDDKCNPPVVGDRLVCRKNNHERGVLNGTMWRVVETGAATGLSIPITVESIDDPELGRFPVDINEELITENVDPPQYVDVDDPLCFQFGNSITCHVSQGSEWPKGYVYDESHFFKKNASRWLYTAVTRFSEDLTLAVKMR